MIETSNGNSKSKANVSPIDFILGHLDTLYKFIKEEGYERFGDDLKEIDIQIIAL